MGRYLLDTVVLVRHFTGAGKIGRAASRILDGADERSDVLAISVVSLMEVLYLAEKNRIALSLAETLEAIEASPTYAIVDLNPEILKTAVTLRFPELHDRLILATARWLDVPLLSSDGGFADVDEVDVIWD